MTTLLTAIATAIGLIFAWLGRSGYQKIQINKLLEELEEIKDEHDKAYKAYLVSIRANDNDGIARFNADSKRLYDRENNLRQRLRGYNYHTGQSKTGN